MKITKSMVIAASLAGCLTVGGVAGMSTSFADGANASSEKNGVVKHQVMKGAKQNSSSAAIDENVKEVTAGESFKITLEENTSTGYSWSYKSDSDAIQLIAENSEAPSQTDPPMMGAPSQKTWTFKADKKGTYTLKFSYARPWEKDVPAVETVTCTIKVTDETTKSKAKEIVTLKADGANAIKKDQKFNITLEENSSTGYSWNYVTSSKDIKLIDEHNQEKKADDGLEGAPSQKTWTFKVDKKGTYILKFSYAQSWDANAHPEQTMIYKIVVE
ncbi:inhibitor of cysteine peptidase [Fontibacillus panacisegetis]|uniref:Inhibitor of cysteine peptidase n=1 Tax=Fontibacillus panacisegetis TaxID=670482 RepID=A0A1G7M0U5_9BACL|nr:protease inhibitor I42 family protein [Fontibacillus panacisegetis]SDF55367.1 inhibitor of cysteine peptidase [Fontibacillus panacisegetis]